MDIETLTLDYWIAVLRVQRMAVPALDKVIVLADLGVIYRAERDRLRPCRVAPAYGGSDV